MSSPMPDWVNAAYVGGHQQPNNTPQYTYMNGPPSRSPQSLAHQRNNLQHQPQQRQSPQYQHQQPQPQYHHPQQQPQQYQQQQQYQQPKQQQPKQQPQQPPPQQQPKQQPQQHHQQQQPKQQQQQQHQQQLKQQPKQQQQPKQHQQLWPHHQQPQTSQPQQPQYRQNQFQLHPPQHQPPPQHQLHQQHQKQFHPQQPNQQQQKQPQQYQPQQYQPQQYQPQQQQQQYQSPKQQQFKQPQQPQQRQPQQPQQPQQKQLHHPQQLQQPQQQQQQHGQPQLQQRQQHHPQPPQPPQQSSQQQPQQLQQPSNPQQYHQQQHQQPQYHPQLQQPQQHHPQQVQHHPQQQYQPPSQYPSQQLHSIQQPPYQPQQQHYQPQPKQQLQQQYHTPQPKQQYQQQQQTPQQQPQQPKQQPPPRQQQQRQQPPLQQQPQQPKQQPSQQSPYQQPQQHQPPPSYQPQQPKQQQPQQQQEQPKQHQQLWPQHQQPQTPQHQKPQQQRQQQQLRRQQQPKQQQPQQQQYHPQPQLPKQQPLQQLQAQQSQPPKQPPPQQLQAKQPHPPKQQPTQQKQHQTQIRISAFQYATIRSPAPRIPSLEPHMTQIHHSNLNRFLYSRRVLSNGQATSSIAYEFLPTLLNTTSYANHHQNSNVDFLQERSWAFHTRIKVQQHAVMCQRVNSFNHLSKLDQSVALVATGSFIQPSMLQYQDSLVPHHVQKRERILEKMYPPGKRHAYVPNDQLPILSHPQLQFQNTLSIERPSDRLPPQHYETSFRHQQPRESNHALTQIEQLYSRVGPSHALQPGLSEPHPDNIHNEMGYPRVSGGSPILGSVRLAKRISHPIKRPSPFSRYPALARAQHFKSLSTSSLWGSNQTPYYLRLNEILLGIAILLHAQLCMAPLYHSTSPYAGQAVHSADHYYSKYIPRSSHLPNYVYNAVFDESSYTHKVTDILPQVEDIQKFFKGVFEVGQFHPQTAIFTLIYLNRYLSRSRLQLTATNWKPLATSCLVVAQKMWDDTPLVNADFHILYPPLELQNINSLERIIVDAMEFDLLINRQTFIQASFELSLVVENFRHRFYFAPLFSKSNVAAMQRLDGLPRNYANALKDRSEKLLKRLYTPIDLDSRTVTADLLFIHSKSESNALAHYGFTHMRPIRFGPFQRVTDMVDRLDISRIHSSDIYARNKPEFKKNVMTPEFIDDNSNKYQLFGAGS